MRRCVDCGEEKALEAFHVTDKAAGRRAPYCNPCGSTRSLRWYHANKDKAQARLRQWRQSNPEKVREERRSWDRRNPGRRAFAEAQRRASLNATPAEIALTRPQWAAIKAAYAQRCAYCGVRPPALTMDHVTPLVRGGKHTAANIIPACKSCNSRKHDGPAGTHQPLLLVGA